MPQQVRMAWPPFTKNIKITLGVLVGLFLVTVLVPPAHAFAREFLYLSSAQVLEGKVWTLLSYAVLHADFGHILFNGVALWFFGSYLDERWTSKKFWAVSAACALGGGLVVLASQLILGNPAPTLGYSGAVMGLVAAYCWYNWNRRLNFFFFPMTGKTLLLFFVALDAFLVIFAREPISIAGHLGGLVTGLLIATEYWRPSRLKRWWHRRSMKKKFRDAKRDLDRKKMN